MGRMRKMINRIQGRMGLTTTSLRRFSSDIIKEQTSSISKEILIFLLT